MLKRILSLLAFVLVALVSSAFARVGDKVTIDVILRDFNSSTPGFEEFDYDKQGSSAKCAGNGKSKSNPLNNSSNAICFTGSGDNREYGYCEDLGFPSCITEATGNPSCPQHLRDDKYSNYVYVTRGMVKEDLKYIKANCERDGLVQGDSTDHDYIRYRYCASPQKGNGACYGDGVESWFKDESPTIKVYQDTITMTEQADGTLLINENGYFPLDKYGNSRDHNYGFSMMGSASFKWLGPNGDKFEFLGDDDMWIFIDGELVADLGGVHVAAPTKVDIDKLAQKRGWTPKDSMHAINFFYLERQTSEANLKLQVRLNGISSSAFVGPRILKAETTQNSDGTSETVIYVNTKINKEQMESFIGSGNFPIIITTANPENRNVYGFKLESISEPTNKGGSNGFAYVIEGQACKNKSCDSTAVINSGDSLSFNVTQADYTVNGTRYSGASSFALPSDTLYIKATNGRKADQIQWALNTSTSPDIEFKPEVADDNPRKPVFDVNKWFTGDPKGGNSGGGIMGGSVGRVEGSGKFPQINTVWNPATKEMEPIPDRNTEVHGFGTKGTAIPPQRAGELLLTAYPYTGEPVKGMPYSDWEKNKELQKLFGLPPEVLDSLDLPYGLADPTVQTAEGGYMFVKNGFPGESSVGGRMQVVPTRCVSNREDPEKPRINCLNFSLIAKQPFRIVVTVYDQLGSFVTQYREEVNEQEFRSVVQGPSFVSGSGIEKIDPIHNSTDSTYSCLAPVAGPGPNGNYGKPNTMTINGFIKVNVNIYPFSANGRRFGNGVYILKIDRVDLPYKGCFTSGGQASSQEETFMRYHADKKFGWMRAE